jgi:hypothetical protein
MAAVHGPNPEAGRLLIFMQGMVAGATRKVIDLSFCAAVPVA